MAKFCGSPRYPIGTHRARTWRGRGDVRGYRPTRGWIASGVSERPPHLALSVRT